jgi:hypothetical protein
MCERILAASLPLFITFCYWISLQVRDGSFFEQLNQVRIHELELVGNIQADDSVCLINQEWDSTIHFVRLAA